MKNASFAAVALGIVLLALSTLWTTIWGGTSRFTEKQANRWTEIKERMHHLAPQINNPDGRISMHAGPDLGQLKAEYDQLVIEHEELQYEFDSVAVRPQKTATVLKWTGIILAAIGIIAWYAATQSR